MLKITQPFGDYLPRFTYEDDSKVEAILTTEHATYSISPAMTAGARVILGAGPHFAVLVKWNDEDYTETVWCHHRTRVEAIEACFTEALFAED